jgi:cobalt-zinc-cadmium efflux system membrane fusion protein
VCARQASHDLLSSQLRAWLARIALIGLGIALGLASGRALRGPRPALPHARPGARGGGLPPGVLDASRLGRMGVRFSRITLGGSSVTLDLVGDLELDRERMAEIASHTSGRIASVLAVVGQRVRRGQTLAWLESATVSDALAQRRVRRAELEAAVQQLARMERLREQGAAAQLEVETALAQRRAVQARLDAALMQLRTLGVDTTQANGPTGRAPLATPIDGTVIERRVVLGSWINPEQEAFIVADLATLWAELDVFEADLDAIRQGDPVRIDIGALGVRGLPGTVEVIYAELDRATRMGKVRLVVPNPDGRLRPGLSLAAHLPLRSAPASVIEVPIESVRDHEGRTSVLVREGARAIWTPVEVGQRYGAMVSITSGLAPGAEIAVSGLGLIAPGAGT